MNICGIVCEYNPFHNGHLHHIEETKRRGADAIVCIMSGNFVQRGDFAIMQKHARAEAAIHCGADIVFELPLPWATASAERFAHGALSLLESLGVVSHISFGAENAIIDKLLGAAEILICDEFNNSILNRYSNGISYAKARELALAEYNCELAKLLKTPNNILAIEYLKAILRIKSNIIPIAIPRKGADHDEKKISDGISSASFIREYIADGTEFAHFLPLKSYELYMLETVNGHAPVMIENADRAIMSFLKKLTPGDFLKYNDVSEGLEFRLFDAVSSSISLSEAIDKAKTKRYARSRIRRIFLNAFLGVKSNVVLENVPYARVLAFNDVGRDVIRKSKKVSKIPIITRPSAIKYESQKAQDLLTLEKNADDIYSLFMPSPIKQGSTFTRSPIYVEKAT